MNKDAFSVSGFYRWNRLQIDPEPVLESFASAGTKYLVFDAETTFAFSEKLSFVRDLYKKAERYGLTFRDAHAPWGAGKDLNELTEESFVRHANIMAILGEYQVKTYTCHIGASCIYTTKDWEGNEEHYRSLAAKALERLLKCAEKYQVTLCVENCFEPATAAPDRKYPQEIKPIPFREEDFYPVNVPDFAQCFYDNLYDYIQNNAEPIVPPADTIALMKTLEQCRIMAEGK